ncbi:MAG TPA: hypothetical protein VN602_13060 [Gemmatimonadaceae bacterium]|nr:hypothetical protein [Gemmatimonadaceae bacterium]
MDPGHIINNAISCLAVVLSLGIVGWTIVAFTRARRGKVIATNPSPELLQPVEQRLQRLEQTTEAIALEVERVAEGQRFVTKLLSDAEHQPSRLGTPR